MKTPLAPPLEWFDRWLVSSPDFRLTPFRGFLPLSLPVPDSAVGRKSGLDTTGNVSGSFPGSGVAPDLPVPP